MPKVGIVMGSKSDLAIVEESINTLKSFGVDVEVRIISAHRTPDIAREFAVGATKGDIEVIIAAAGKAAHLGGVLASFTTVPVIGLPIRSSTMDGLDSLLSMVQMPSGVPVATVAINGGTNAGLLAVQILSLKYRDLANKFAEYKKAMERTVMKDDELLQLNFNK